MCDVDDEGVLSLLLQKSEEFAKTRPFPTRYNILRHMLERHREPDIRYQVVNFVLRTQHRRPVSSMLVQVADHARTARVVVHVRLRQLLEEFLVLKRDTATGVRILTLPDNPAAVRLSNPIFGSPNSVSTRTLGWKRSCIGPDADPKTEGRNPNPSPSPDP